MPIVMTTKQVANVFGLKEQTIRAWRSAGVGPTYFRLGGTKRGQARYLLSDVEKWLEDQQRFRNTAEESLA